MTDKEWSSNDNSDDEGTETSPAEQILIDAICGDGSEWRCIGRSEGVLIFIAPNGTPLPHNREDTVGPTEHGVPQAGRERDDLRSTGSGKVDSSS